MLTPNENMMAPTATCAVAMSAALLLQITQAPSVICTNTPINHKIDNRRSGVSRARVAPEINLLERIRASVRDPRASRRRKIENGKITMLMTHGRAECELQVNRDRGRQRDVSDSRKIDMCIRKIAPKICSDERNENEQR